MRHLITILALMFTFTSANAQNFSLVGGQKPTKIAISSEENETPSSLSVSAIPITILLTNYAEVRDVEGGKKAVFIGQTDTITYSGVMIKISGQIKNPLLRIYKKPNLFPPAIMKKYSDTEWFYYGEPGNYIVEYLDAGDSGWNSEFIEVEVKGKITDPTKPTDPTDPTKPTDPNPPGSGDYSSIRSATTTMVKSLNDPTVANSLVKEYTSALTSLTGTIADMRIKIRDARRTAFLNVPSRNANWNDSLLKVDQMMIEQGVDTEEEYKSAVKAYVDGISDGLK